MGFLEQAEISLGEGRLAEVRRLLVTVTRAPDTPEKFQGLMLLAEAELLSNTLLELTGTLAFARRTATALADRNALRRVQLWSYAAALAAESHPHAEVAELREQDLPPAEKTLLDALDAVHLAREGRTGEAEGRLSDARRTVAAGGAHVVPVYRWLVKAHLLLGQAEEAEQVARAGAWVAEGLGCRGYRDELVRLGRSAGAAASPVAQEAVLKLVELASATSGERDLKPLLDQVGRATLELLEVDRTFVIVRGTDKPLAIATSLGRDGPVSGVPSWSLVERAIRTGLPVVSNDLHRDGGERSDSILSMGLRSVICVPLLHGTKVLGAIYGDSERVTEHELQQVAWLARGLAGVASVSVANALRLRAAERATQEGREIAHDVRNLLSGVLLSSEDLSEAPDVPEWAREVAQLAHSATVRMRQHLERLLEARASTRTKVRIDDMVTELVGLMDRTARAREVRFALQVEPVSLSIEVDEFGRALTNLLANALKYAPEGTEVSVRVVSSERTVTVSVSDQGPGIPADQLESIFSSGAQGRGAVQGHGLGLGIAARVVADHGGRIWAENVEAGGARFAVELPLL